MKLTIPAPATIFDKPYSLLEMARFITSKDRRYNRTADEARSGARLVAAIAAAGTKSQAEVDEADLRVFADAVERPSCGWGMHEVETEHRDPRTGETRLLKRKGHASTVDYLPLIDSVAADAKALPPLPTK